MDLVPEVTPWAVDPPVPSPHDVNDASRRCRSLVRFHRADLPDPLIAQQASDLDPGTAANDARAATSVRRMLLATDLSSASEGATRQALDLARDLRAQLLIVSVIDPTARSLPGSRVERIDQQRAARLASAQAVVARGREEGVAASFLVWEGEPGPAIVEAAASEQVDMIVVGSHGRGAMGRLLIGSVSDFVVRNAPCPVLVVRPRPKA